MNTTQFIKNKRHRFYQLKLVTTRNTRVLLFGTVLFYFFVGCINQYITFLKDVILEETHILFKKNTSFSTTIMTIHDILWIGGKIIFNFLFAVFMQSWRGPWRHWTLSWLLVIVKDTCSHLVYPNTCTKNKCVKFLTQLVVIGSCKRIMKEKHPCCQWICGLSDA